MDVRAVNLNLLTALDALLEARNVTRAARQAGLSQPAMSHALAQLRKLFDDPLLTRDGLLTPLAESLRAPLRSALVDVQQVVSMRHRFEPSTTRRNFRVAVSDALQVTALHRLYAELAREAPAVGLFVRAPRAGTFEALASGDIDLILGSAQQAPRHCATRVLYRERFVCIVRADHPRISSKLTLAGFCSAAHALVSEDDGPGELDVYLAARGRERRIAVRAPDFAGIGHFVAASDLLATVPERLARALAVRLPLRVLELPLRVPRFEVSMYWHPRHDADPAHAWLRERMLAVA